MERCLDCNGLLTATEKVCPICGKPRWNGKPSLSELAVRAGTGVFYGLIVALIVSRFTSGASFIAVVGVCCGLLILLMWKKTR